MLKIEISEKINKKFRNVSKLIKNYQQKNFSIESSGKKLKKTQKEKRKQSKCLKKGKKKCHCTVKFSL